MITAIQPRHRIDIIVPKAKVAIEVDGCYWHHCKRCGFNGPIDFKRRLAIRNAKKLGWKLIGLWEHEINNGQAFEKLAALLASREVIGS